MEQTQVKFDKSVIEQIWGKVSPKLENALLYIWKSGEPRHGGGENRNIRFTGDVVHILLPDGMIKYENGTAKTLSRNELLAPDSIKTPTGAKHTYFQSGDWLCMSEYDTITGYRVKVEVLRYDTSKPAPASGLYPYEFAKDREGGIRKLSVGGEDWAILSQSDAALYYFFLLSHWSRENFANGKWKQNQSQLGIFYEKDEKAEEAKRKADRDNKYNAMTFVRKIEGKDEMVNAISAKFIELFNNYPNVDNLKPSVPVYKKHEELMRISENDKWCANLLRVEREVGDLVEFTQEDIKEKVANSFKLGILLRNEQMEVILNTSPVEGNFTTEFQGTDLADKNYVFWTCEKPEFSVLEFAQMVYENKDSRLYQTLFEVERKEYLKFKADGISPNYKYDEKVNRFVGTNNTWAKLAKKVK